MARLDAEEIYAYARAAGFSPDQAVTMTAIALAESGGETGAHNPHGEDSRGLWQINLEAHAGSSWAQGLDLYDPRDSAIAAWHVSQQGADIRPWTVTHDDRGSRYAKFADDARAASAAHGEPATGNFDGPANYHDDPVPAGGGGGDPFTGPVPDFDGDAGGGGGLPAMPAAQGSVQRFLEAALAQEGDTYVFDAQADDNDPDPDKFDCSELVEWAAEQAGAPEVAEASYLQYLQFKEAGTLIPVEQAINTPGAVLFRFPDHEPRPGEGRQDGSHVAISLGDGRTFEAMSPSAGIGFNEAADRGFNYAALIPGLDYAGGVTTLEPMPAPAPAPAPPNPLDIAAWNSGSVDTDRDGLPDFFETQYGLNPEVPDTDGDGITDGYELVVIGAKADRADTDFDQMSDGLEIALGYNPLVADNPDPDVQMLIPDELHVDTDGDGLTDWLEELAGTNPENPDTDADGVLDGDQYMFGQKVDPLGAGAPGADPLDDDGFDDTLDNG
jgi:cell wall-associated NlpC family hydrolase